MTKRSSLTHNGLLIVDFGSQYTQLIARRLREQGFFCELVDPDQVVRRLQADAVRGIILSGGPDSVSTQEVPSVMGDIFNYGVPILGICYGMQAMAQYLGGQVEAGSVCEFGHAQLQLAAGGLMPQLELPQLDIDVWMSHGDHVQSMPPGFQLTASTDSLKIAAMADHSRHYYGLQFHPEVTHSEQGEVILAHFAATICGCDASWTSQHIIDYQLQAVRAEVNEAHVVLGLSGGVDSSVTAALLHRAIGKQLVCIFVDTGLLRAGEVEEVETLFAKHMGLHLITVDAKQRFCQALAGISDPEQKRKVVGHEFIAVFSEQAKQIPGCKFLAQGTIYPDVIESARTATGAAKVIKSHHNVGGLPDDLPFDLIEPLRELFKDEVRRLGEELGLPHDLLYRHPFPGPGLCVRILGEVKADYIPILQAADKIFIDQLRAHNLYDEVSQAFAVFLPIKAVGVKGDQRCYDYVIALRAVKTIDFMTAEWAQLPYDFLAAVSLEIMNQVPQVARVVYDISGKPPATIEWE